jgi:hypothetical protein
MVVRGGGGGGRPAKYIYSFKSIYHNEKLEPNSIE